MVIAWLTYDPVAAILLPALAEPGGLATFAICISSQVALVFGPCIICTLAKLAHACSSSHDCCGCSLRLWKPRNRTPEIPQNNKKQNDKNIKNKLILIPVFLHSRVFPFLKDCETQSATRVKTLVAIADRSILARGAGKETLASVCEATGGVPSVEPSTLAAQASASGCIPFLHRKDTLGMN
eukprot:5389359-Amphidinium_carterae.3